MVPVKLTRPLTLVLTSFGTAVAGSALGIYQVSHGRALPVATSNTIITMPVVALLLAGLALPVYRYRKALLARLKTKTATAPARPKPLDPFYAVRILLLAKSTAIASAAMFGFQVGLVILQLSTPVVSGVIWMNIGAAIGDLFALAVGLAIERICRIPDDGSESQPSEATA